MYLAYIILLGRLVWASLNTFYSVVSERDHKPDVVWLVTEERYEDDLVKLDEGIQIIGQGFDFKPKTRSTIIEEGNIIDAGVEVRGIIESLRPEHLIALDITSARKALVAGALLATTDCKPDHIFYLMIDTLEDISKPYPMIPFVYQHLMDLREQSTRSRV